jgi:putative membrane protein
MSTIPDLHNNPRSLKQYLRLFFTGAAMGAADLVPGVSGGTMAFILGIYEDLLNAIKSFSLDLVRMLLRFDMKAALAHVPWRFLLTLMLGLGSTVLLLANAMEWLLENEPVYLFAFFFGLVLASILAVGARITWSLKTGSALLVGTLVAYMIVTLLPLSMPHDPLTLFLSGMIAIMAMILPGISGSFILLILGQYDYVLSAVSDLNILAIIPVGLGSIVGLLGFARVLSWLLNRYEQTTVAVLVGFMAGSLYKIWPWKVVLQTRIDRHGEEVAAATANYFPALSTAEFWLALALCLAGFLLVSVLDHLQSRANPLFRIGRKDRVDVAPLPEADG